jgi:hypothetical protein
MATRFFQLVDNLGIKGRWHLNGLADSKGRELDSRDFRYGLPVELGPPMKVSLYNQELVVDVHGPLRVTLQYKGKPLDFTFAGDEMPVVTTKVADLIAKFASSDIQRIPVQVASREEHYEIINVVSRIDCIDVKRSEIDEWWTEEDDRPDKIGKPRMIYKLVIDPGRVGNSNIFRPEGWEVATIVSEVIKDAFERAEVTGVRFSAV